VTFATAAMRISVGARARHREGRHAHEGRHGGRQQIAHHVALHVHVKGQRAWNQTAPVA
jgi:hypothetical protein